MDNSRQLNQDDDKICIESAVKFSTRRYVGRLAPTPSGYLHIGHAQTFWIAQQRCNRSRRNGSDGTGSLILRIEDLDKNRCKPHYLTDMLYDMSWFDLSWTHGPTLVATDVDSCSSSSSSSSNADCVFERTDDDDEDNRLPKKSKMVGNEAVVNAITSTNSTGTANDGSLMDLVRFRLFHGVSLTPFAHVFQQVTNPPVPCHRYIVCTSHCFSGSLPSFLLPSFVFGQSRRMPLYHAAWRRLVQLRLIYPSPHSRKGHSNSSSHFITKIQILFLSLLNRTTS